MGRMRWLLGLFLIFLFAACTDTNGASETKLDFLPIDEIVDSELVITDFINGTANLPIQTSIPVACSIVYGTSPDFGSIATDLDMAGGAHAEHNPLLTGLASNTEYYYRVQGVDAAGNIYVSNVMTFTTPDFEAASATSNNLAQSASITDYSSIFGNGTVDSQWGANNAIDGNPNTQWSSNGDGDDAWIELELAAETHITRIGFWTRTMGTSAQIESFQIVTDRDETFGPFVVSDAAEVFYFDVDFIAQRLRFEVLTSSGGNTGAIEIEVYGEPQG
jgi:hypothetical protein